MGGDLVALRALAVHELLGHSNFFAMCQAACGLSETFVTQAIDVATRLGREQAVELGTQGRAAAFLELARATPEEDTPTDLAKRGLTRGRVKLPPDASGRKARAAAKAIRDEVVRKKDGKVRGRTTTPAERDEAARLAQGLTEAGFEVTVEVFATRAGQPGVFALRLPREAFPALKKLLPAK